MILNLINIIGKCKDTETNILWNFFKHLYYSLYGADIFSANRVIIKGIKNIETIAPLSIGMGYVGFLNKHDRTYLNIRGKLIIKGKYSIARGCRFDIGPNAIATFGAGYVNANTKFVIMHGIEIGDNCVISWDCQFLDEDFHSIIDENSCKPENDNRIVLGEHVWVGSKVTILKSVSIPDGCVIASGSVVCKSIQEKNALIAGTPARIIRHNIQWE